MIVQNIGGIFSLRRNTGYWASDNLILILYGDAQAAGKVNAAAPEDL